MMQCLIDEGCACKYLLPDADNDGYGDINSSVQNCNQPAGYVTNNTDCMIMMAHAFRV
jgi:hypothetical protein